MYNSADSSDEQLTLLQLTGGLLVACLLFCGLNTLMGYAVLAGGASERYHYHDATIYPDFF